MARKMCTKKRERKALFHPFIICGKEMFHCLVCYGIAKKGQTSPVVCKTSKNCTDDIRIVHPESAHQNSIFHLFPPPFQFSYLHHIHSGAEKQEIYVNFYFTSSCLNA